MEKRNLGSFEIVLTLVGITVVKLFSFKTEDYLNIFSSGIFIWLIFSFLFYYLLFRLFIKHKNKIENSKIIGVLFYIFLIYQSGALLFSLTNMLGLITLPKTPKILILIAISVLTFIYGTNQTNNIIRISGVITPILVLILLGTSLFCFPYYDFTNLAPILGNINEDIFIKISFSLSFFAESLVLFFIKDVSKDKIYKAGKKSLLYSFIIIFIVFLAMILCNVGVLNSVIYPPFFQMARMVSLGSFVKRAEAITIIPWVLSSLFAITVYINLASEILSNLFNKKHFKTITFFTSLAVFVLSFFIYK